MKSIELKDEGNAFYKNGKFSDASNAYSKAIELLETAPLYNNRAAAKLMLGDFQGAVGDCLQAIRVDGTFQKAYMRCSTAYCRLGEFERGHHFLFAHILKYNGTKHVISFFAM